MTFVNYKSENRHLLSYFSVYYHKYIIYMEDENIKVSSPETCDISGCDISDIDYINSQLTRDDLLPTDIVLMSGASGGGNIINSSPIPAGLWSSFGARLFAVPLIAQGLQTIGDAVANRGREIFVNGINSVARGINNFGRGKGGGRSGPGGSNFGGNVGGIVDVPPPPPPGNSSDPSSPAYRGGISRLNYDPSPIRVNLNTGIKANTYSSIYQDKEWSFKSPLHLSLNKFQIPVSATNKNSKIGDYFDNIITIIFNNLLQQAVSFNIDAAGTILTKANLRYYFNTIADALQIYFFYNSVLTYTENSQNRNSGMIYLRSLISAEDLNNLINVKRLLMGTPIPPNLLNYLFYLNQSYATSDIPGLSIIKICPLTWSATTNGPDSSNISAAVTSFNDTTFKQIAGLMARGIPSWLNTTIPDVCDTPICDDNFTTIWANLPHTATASGVSYNYPQVTSTSGLVYYNSFTNNLDGAAYSLMTMWNTASTGNEYWTPALITPISTLGYSSSSYSSNRLSYYGTSQPFMHAWEHIQITAARPETYRGNRYVTSYMFSSLPTDAQTCEQVTANSVTETLYKTIEWLLSFDTIGRIKDKREYGLTNFNEFNPHPRLKSKQSSKRSKVKSKTKPKPKRFSSSEEAETVFD